jgi:hypothetical protein
MKKKIKMIIKMKGLTKKMLEIIIMKMRAKMSHPPKKMILSNP